MITIIIPLSIKKSFYIINGQTNLNTCFYVSLFHQQLVENEHTINIIANEQLIKIGR